MSGRTLPASLRAPRVAREETPADEPAYVTAWHVDNEAFWELCRAEEWETLGGDMDEIKEYIEEMVGASLRWDEVRERLPAWFA